MGRKALAYKKWIYNGINKALANSLADDCDIDPFVALIATSRGYSDPADLEEFLSTEPMYNSPYEINGITAAAEVINTAVNENKLIAVYGDYDCDGITSTALLYGYLKDRGARVVYYIPDRFDEGYGMSDAGIDKLHAMGTELIITVDNGISSYEQVEYANSLNIKTVITDHHIPPEILPNAEVIVNPHLENSGCSFKEISGVCVAFKLVCALEDAYPEQLAPKYADLVAIGLIADVMPLVNENRTIVREGLRYINSTSKMGIISLLNSAGIRRGDVTAERIAFGIAPRINAAGRMGNAEPALKLLLSNEFHEAASLAREIEEKNTLRQKVSNDIYNEAVGIIEREKLQYQRIIVVAGKDWHNGVVGIVAAKIVEKYGKPAIVLSVNGDTATGSGRSVEGFPLFDTIREAQEFLIKFGGHEMAAGVTLSADKIDGFRNAVNKSAEKHGICIPAIKIDCKLNPAGLSVDMAEAIKILEPFGTGNSEPIFAVCGVTIKKITELSGNKHIKLTLSRENATFNALLFNVSSDVFPFDLGQTVDIAVTLGVNEYAGNTSLSVIIRNIRPNNLNEDVFFSEKAEYDRFMCGENVKINLTREEIGEVYRFLQNNCTMPTVMWHFVNSLGYLKTNLAADVLLELGIIEKGEKQKNILSVVAGKRANLENSQILKRLE